MIGTVEANIETMRMNAASMICDKIKSIKYKKGCEQCIKLCYYENRDMGVNVGLNHKKDKVFSKWQECIITFKNMLNTLISRKSCWFQE